jgi:hypothetical protein
VVIHGAVFPIAAQAFELAHLLFVIFVMLPEYRQQRFMVHTQSQIGVTHFLGGYIVIPVGDLPVGLIDTHTDFIQYPVVLLRHHAATGPRPNSTLHDFSSTSSLQLHCAILPFTVIRHITEASPFFFVALRFR